ncbi:hypothetical protein Vadar_020399 [Vaccinium darrowii]|uniref:Uncharacterized protein n=1 Tax=Vaccinium darrowii TaxID=229202 RepID=A0ACB7X2F3_9ERIC|nr:hypothetical protein Vadar_020399 [Vaccinium darrowii]
MLGASSDHGVVIPASSSIHGTVESSAGDNSGLSICKVEDEVEDKRDYDTAKWMMSKKIRIVQKMMSTGSHEKQERIIKIKFPDLAKDKCEINSPSNCGNVVRICSDCKTSKTPLWRSGPQGPKSLCNACGIRQRKARRAMLAAAAVANGTVDVTTEDNSETKTKVQKKEKKSRSSYHMTQFKKAFGTPQGDRERISFEDFALSLSKSLAFGRVFPKDEEEAAILLMALSCGLLHS